MTADLQYFRTAILASVRWPERNRCFQNGLAAIFSQHDQPFEYCHQFTGQDLGYTGTEEAISQRITRDLWKSKRAMALVGRRTFEHVKGGGNLKRPTRYITNYLNTAAEFLRATVEADREAIPLAVKVHKHLPKAKKLLPRVHDSKILHPGSKDIKTRRKRKRGAASYLTDILNDLSPLGLEALKYAGDRFSVIPLHTAVDGTCSCKKGAECGDSGKHPRIARWLQCATRNRQVIAEWWRRWPDAGIGIKTGTQTSKGLYLVVIDVDRRLFGHGLLSSLLDELGEDLPETRTVISADGWHYYFWIHLDSPPSSFGFSGKGVEIKGSAGVVAAPPTVHRSGYVYRLESDTPIAILSGAFAEWVSAKGRRAKVPINERHDFLVRCGRRLAGDGFSEAVILGTLKSRLASCCEQGGRVIDESELSGIARWAVSVEAQKSSVASRVA